MRPSATTDLDELRRRLVESLLALERAGSPIERVDAARAARALGERLEIAALAEAREAKLSWAKIGASYRLTKQGAQQRFAAPIAALEAGAPEGDSPAPID